MNEEPYGRAVFYGDFAFPEASAIKYEQQSSLFLEKKDPQAALTAARQAVAIAPKDFRANLALGDAAVAAGDRPTAQAAYETANLRIADMEPTAQAVWTPILKKKMASVISTGSPSVSPVM